MGEDDPGFERELGEATIVFDDPDDGTVKTTLPNEHTAYFQDHWIIKTEEDDEGNDIIRRIPVGRVHYVERSVEEFEEEVKTVRNQVQSVAESLRAKLLGEKEDHESTGEVQQIEVD